MKFIWWAWKPWPLTLAVRMPIWSGPSKLPTYWPAMKSAPTANGAAGSPC